MSRWFHLYSIGHIAQALRLKNAVSSMPTRKQPASLSFCCSVAQTIATYHFLKCEQLITAVLLHGAFSSALTVLVHRPMLKYKYMSDSSSACCPSFVISDSNAEHHGNDHWEGCVCVYIYIYTYISMHMHIAS